MNISDSFSLEKREPAADDLAAQIQARGQRLLALRGVDDYCDVCVEQREGWTVFWGQVDSQATRTRLFLMVPEIGGERRIVDNLRVVPLTANQGN
jgi:hypothetical protein